MNIQEKNESDELVLENIQEQPIDRVKAQNSKPDQDVVHKIPSDVQNQHVTNGMPDNSKDKSHIQSSADQGTLKEAEMISHDNIIKNDLQKKIDTINFDTHHQQQMLFERITTLEQKLITSQNQVREIQLRSQAEIENIRRRAEIDIEKAHKFSLEKFVIELLPVIDSLQRALEVVDQKNTLLIPMIEGIQLTLKSLLDAISKFGVEIINKNNVPFNPDIHQAMSVLESEEVLPNHVLMIMQHGYKLNGRLLRAAMVTVAKSKE